MRGVNPPVAARINRRSKADNPKHGITGVLCYSQGIFIQVLEGGRLKSGSMWVVPQNLYSPIHQDAVVLKRGAGNEAVKALVKLLKSPNIKELIRSYGYEL